MPFKFNPITGKLDIVDITTTPATVPEQFTTDAGVAVPAAKNLNIVGGVGITTSAVGDTVTVTSIDAGLAWTEVTGTTQNMAVNNAYIANNVALVTLNLPTTAAVGDLVWVVGKGTGLWKIGQAAGQTIHYGNTDSTTGVGGSVTALHRYDALQLVCTVANTDWTCTGVSQGNLSVT